MNLEDGEMISGLPADHNHEPGNVHKLEPEIEEFKAVANATIMEDEEIFDDLRQLLIQVRRELAPTKNLIRRFRRDRKKSRKMLEEARASPEEERTQAEAALEDEATQAEASPEDESTPATISPGDAATHIKASPEEETTKDVTNETK